MDAELEPIHEHKGDKDDAKSAPFRHPMADGTGAVNKYHSIMHEDVSSPPSLFTSQDSPLHDSSASGLHKEYSSASIRSPPTRGVLFKDTSSPAVMHKVRTASPMPAFPVVSPRSRSKSSPPQRERSNSIATLAREKSVFIPPQRERSNSVFAVPHQRERSGSIFGIPQRERSNSVFKEGKPKDGSTYTLNKLGIQRRNELDQFLKHRGFSDEELDSIVQQFHQIQEKLEGGEWVTREQFKNFFGVREQAFSDHLFEVFKQRHKMHNFEELDFCPSPQMSRERPRSIGGTEIDAINLREFLCGLLLLQSSDVDKKLRMVFDLYNENGYEITKESLKNMMMISAKENKIALSDEQVDTIVDHIFQKMDVAGSGKIAFEQFKTAFLESPIELEQRAQNTPLSQFLEINKASPTSPMKPFSWTINVDDISAEGADEALDRIGTVHPDFVERDYEDEDPQRTQSKQQKFENREKGNYFPQQESMPKKKVKVHKKFRTRLHASGTKYLFLTLFSLINIGFFAWEFTRYARRTEVVNMLGWGIPIARGFAQVLKIDTILLLIPVSRNLLTYVRATPVHRIIPLDKNISFHKVIAIMVMVASVGHWAAHLANFYYISTASLADLQSINPSYFTSVPSYVALNFVTMPGLTGYIMLVALVIIFMFASKRVRKHNFERFYITHYFFIVFYAALVIHGMSRILGYWEYWKWLIAGGSIYVIERAVRLIKQRRNVKVIEATILPDRAVMLKMAIPTRGFTYKAGQYIFVNFPMISIFEWHPFTLTSAPHEDYISCHIRAAGNWTKKVYALCEGFKEKVPDFVKVKVDGPYGSASEHVFTYKHVIMIGAGIGVTPFASVLKRILHRFEQRKPMKLEKVHFFWTCREQGAFQWFADLLSELESHENAKSFLETNTFLTGALAQHDIRSILLWYGLQQEYSVNNVDLVTGLSSRTYWGRPNWDRIIECMFAQYPKERVGVFFCGPSPLAHSLRTSCKKYASLNGSTFYFHKENF